MMWQVPVVNNAKAFLKRLFPPQHGRMCDAMSDLNDGKIALYLYYKLVSGD